jgi:hypothetical protein
MKKIIYVFGTGPSINDITEEEWEYVRNSNSIGFSWFFKKGFETDFYYTHENDHQPKGLAQTIVDSKWEKVKVILGCTDGVFINEPNQFPRLTKRVNTSNFIFSFAGHKWKLEDEVPPVPFRYWWAKKWNHYLCGFKGQLSAVINLCTLLEADEIRLCGIDLYDNTHFYPYEEGSKHVENLKRELGFNPETDNHSQMAPHLGSASILQFIDYIKNHVNLVSCSKNSLLNKTLTYKSIMED